MSEIEFTVCKSPSQKLRGMGCDGFLSTTAKLTASDMQSLREFWKVNSGRLVDREKFKVGERIAPAEEAVA